MRSIDKIDVAVGSRVGQHGHWRKSTNLCVSIHGFNDHQPMVDSPTLVSHPVIVPGTVSIISSEGIG